MTVLIQQLVSLEPIQMHYGQRIRQGIHSVPPAATIATPNKHVWTSSEVTMTTNVPFQQVNPSLSRNNYMNTITSSKCYDMHKAIPMNVATPHLGFPPEMASYGDPA